MNIQKNELLLMNKIKFGAEQPTNTTAAPVPSTEPQTPEAGMNALTFMGMKNLMSNPQLAQSVGVSSNAPSFQGGASSMAKSAGKFLIGAGMLAAAMFSTTSCADQEQDVTIDLSQFTQMMAEFMSKMDKIIAQNENMAEIWKGIAVKIDALAVDVKNGFKTVEQFKSDVAAYFRENNETNKAILKQLEANGKTEEEAKQYLDTLLELYMQDRITLVDLMSEIEGILNNIDSTLSAWFFQYQQAETRKAEHEAKVEASLEKLEKYGKATAEDVAAIKEGQDSIIVQNNIIIDNVAEISKDVKINNRISADANRILLMNGYTQAQFAKMTVKEVTERLDAIAENTAATNEKLDATNAKLEEIYNELRRGNISEAEASKQIIALLKSIDKKLDKIFNRLGDIESKIDKYGKEARRFYYQNHKDAQALIKATYKNYAENKKQTARLDSLITLENEKAVWADSLITQLDEDVKNGTNSVVEAIQQSSIDMENAFQINNMHEEMRAQQLLQFLKSWKAQNHQDNIKLYNGEKTIIQLIEKYGPLLEVKSNSNEGIIDALNEFMKQEKAADEAAAAQQEIDTAAIIDAINEATDAINALAKKVDPILTKMDSQINLAKTYGDRILKALEDNEKAIKALDMEMPDLTVLTNYVKELAANSKTANTYLDILSIKQIEIGDQIANLEAIAGKSLTKDELETLWKQHDADAFAKAKAYLDGLHAEDMGKAQEMIDLRKRGNKIAQDTYDVVNNWAKNADKNAADYKEILNKIYDYLPNLICNCKCEEDVNKNEGIRDDINNLIGG